MGENTDLRLKLGSADIRVTADASMHGRFKAGEKVKVILEDFMVFKDEDEKEREILT